MEKPMNKRVLVIDEDLDTLRLIRIKLSKAGFEVFLARDGEEGLSVAMAQKPHLVIMAMMLAKLDGPTLLGHLKVETEPTPLVLILSDKGQDEDIAAGLLAGADDYMSKPFSPQVLQERVRVNLIKAGQLAPVSEEGS
jgi:two-component system alkaline phosphatase synthesis response regulator PhoP